MPTLMKLANSKIHLTWMYKSSHQAFSQTANHPQTQVQP